MKKLKEFINSKVPMTKTAYNEAYGDAIEYANKVLVYADGFHIEAIRNNEFSLIIERSCYSSKDLNELEQILWDDFAKWEVGVTTKEAEEDLHIRAKDLLDEMGYNCSLDEVDLDIVSESHKKYAEYLLNQFDKINVKQTNKEPSKIEDYRVFAKVTTYCYIDIVATSPLEAEQLASEIDGGDFTTEEDLGEWEIHSINKK